MNSKQLPGVLVATILGFLFWWGIALPGIFAPTDPGVTVSSNGPGSTMSNLPATISPVPTPSPTMEAAAVIPEPTLTPPEPRATKKPKPKKTERAVYYDSCDDAPGTLYRGDPGYRKGLDRDGDGAACES